MSLRFCLHAHPIDVCVAVQAAQLAEVYWMALTRDVPFSKYGEHEDTIAAAGEALNPVKS